MEQQQLLPLIHESVLKKLNNYISAGEITNNIQDYIVQPKLGSKSGILGAMRSLWHGKARSSQIYAAERKTDLYDEQAVPQPKEVRQ